jgi:tetratricopeptide (TPR) repeat protein
MKTLTKLGIALITGGVITVAIFAFAQRDTQPSHRTSLEATNLEIPELLVRSEALKQTAEWQTNTHQVSTISSKLIAQPNDPEALVELSQIFCIEARVTGEHGYYYPTVLTMLDRALAQPNLSEKVLFEATALKANVLLAQHRWNDGLATAQKAHALNPYSAQVYAALIDAHVELGHYAQAVALTDQMMEIKPGLMAYARASYIRELHGDIPGAIDAMRMAVEAGYPGYDNTEWCRMHLAELLEGQGKWDEAEYQYRVSLDYREKNPFAEAGIAGIMIERGQYESAEQLLKGALAAVPEISFQEDLFVLYQRMGREADATEAYRGIIEMVEDDAAHGHQVDLDYAKILFEMGNDTDEALEMVLREYKLRPENVQVNSLLARIYGAQGKLDLARQHLAKAIQTGYQNRTLAALTNQLSQDVNRKFN